MPVLEGARCPVDIGFALTVAERRQEGFQWQGESRSLQRLRSWKAIREKENRIRSSRSLQIVTHIIKRPLAAVFFAACR